MQNRVKNALTALHATMPRYILNRTTFTSRKLEPFGLELTPENQTDILELVQKDIAAIVEASRKNLILVIRNISIPREQRWGSIPSTTNHSNTIWHSDGDGEIVANIFSAPTIRRRPTAFAQRKPIAQAMKKHSEYLNPLFLNSPFEDRDEDIRAITEFYAQLERDHDIQVGTIHSLYVRLCNDARIKKPPFWDYQGRITWEQQILARHACAKALQHFMTAVNREIQKHIFTQRWADTPQTAAIAYNGRENEHLVLAHRRVTEEPFQTETEDPLLRKQVIADGPSRYRLR